MMNRFILAALVSVFALVSGGCSDDNTTDPPQTTGSTTRWRVDWQKTTNRTHPLSDANLTLLSSLEYRFPFPLTSGAVHDTTVIQPFTVWEFTQHAALTKLN